MTPRPTPSKKRQDEAARAAVKVVMDLRRARVGLAIEKKAAEVGAKLHPRQAVKIAEAALDTIGVEHVERCLFESQREAAALRQEKRDVMLSSVANHVIEPGTTIGGTSIAKLHELATQRCADLRIALEAIVNEWNDPHTIPSRRDAAIDAARDTLKALDS